MWRIIWGSEIVDEPEPAITRKGRTGNPTILTGPSRVALWPTDVWLGKRRLRIQDCVVRFALRLVLVAVIGFTGGSLAPSNSLRRDVDPDGRQAVSELQSALTAAARGEPVTSTLFSLQWPPGERSDRSSASSAPVWSRTSIFSLAGLHGGLITDQRRVIRLTCRGARASHLTTEPPERPRLPS